MEGGELGSGLGLEVGELFGQEIGGGFVVGFVFFEGCELCLQGGEVFLNLIFGSLTGFLYPEVAFTDLRVRADSLEAAARVRLVQRLDEFSCRALRRSWMRGFEAMSAWVGGWICGGFGWTGFVPVFGCIACC